MIAVLLVHMAHMIINTRVGCSAGVVRRFRDILHAIRTRGILYIHSTQCD